MDDLTLPEVEELLTYWADHPPTHILVAAYLGIKPKGSGSISKDEQDSSVAAFIGTMGGQVVIDPKTMAKLTQ